MEGLENNTTLITYIISNVVALLILLSAWKRPRLARLVFFIIFISGSFVNWNTALHNPDFYLAYAKFALFDIYRQFILGWFSSHITASVVFIATCQALIAVSMLMRGYIFKAGATGAIIFLFAIAPLGIGSAFPFSLITSLALYLIIRDPVIDYLWVSSKLQYAG